MTGKPNLRVVGRFLNGWEVESADDLSAIPFVTKLADTNRWAATIRGLALLGLKYHVTSKQPEEVTTK